MKTALTIALLAFAATLAGNSQPAQCQHGCISTQCGVDAECDQIAGCRCFVPVGSGVGYCG